MKKTTIITGAGGNLGEAMVQKFSKENHRVVATVSPGKKLGYEVAGEVITHEANLADEKEASALVGHVVSRYQTIHTAILLVGGFGGGGVAETDGEALRKMFSLNFDTAYFIARPVFLHMMKQPAGGRIVLVGSRPAIEPSIGKNYLAYTLSKSLLFNLAACLNAEGNRHVVTSVIVPGTIDTPDNRKFNPGADFSSWVKPERIADIVFFLTSGEGQPLSDPVVKIYGNL